MKLKCIFLGHQWRIVRLYKLSPGFARAYGNADVECKRCGKVSIRYAYTAKP